MRLKGLAPYVAVFIVLAVSNACVAQTMPGSAAFIQRADVVIAAQGESGQPLPVSDPRVQALIVVASDHAVYGDVPLTGQDVPRVAEVALRSASLLRTYMLDTSPAPGSPDPQEQPLTNMRRYQDVIFPLMTLSVYSGAHSLSAMELALASMPESQRPGAMPGLRQVRQGMAQMLAGVLRLPPDSVLTPAHRAALLAAASETAPVVASSLTLKQREDVFRMAFRATRVNPSDERDMFEKIEHAFESKECVGLCAYPD
ncbi:hypothetical protein FIV34_08105 [Luteibacter pinisoli]|uniref:Uncharacterized protein n=1 Tax=Luteibacter pinisoli TaxID=2589080 RepID=A0A4Y5Z3S3_9GAMM|nr:hypothetical protein [Luteibacter pinisoli]QDE39165.1 hypothetical protein FIV34_08105 [Luteibacter pinisoli]